MERFFEERPRWDERVQAINQVARLMVCQPLEGVDDLVVALVAQAEHPHLMDRFLEYWRSLPLPTPPPDL